MLLILICFYNIYKHDEDMQCAQHNKYYNNEMDDG